MYAHVFSLVFLYVVIIRCMQFDVYSRNVFMLNDRTEMHGYLSLIIKYGQAVHIIQSKIVTTFVST